MIEKMDLTAKFDLGQVVATPGAVKRVDPVTMRRKLALHVSGNWGDVDAEDKAANDLALLDGGRLLSVYPIPGTTEEKFWLITEADRSATTFLLPEEY